MRVCVFISDIDPLLNSRRMHSSVCVAIILLVIESILGAHVDDNRVIIGSSVGGVLGLVSYSVRREEKEKLLGWIVDCSNS